MRRASTSNERRRLERAITGIALLVLIWAWGAIAGAAYHGNTRSHVVHAAGCQHYDCPHCTAQFRSLQEAVAEGFRPCGQCLAGATGAPSPRAFSAPERAAAYFGNTQSRKFHRSTCRYAGCAHCTAVFPTRDAAIAAGYVPGGCCRP